MASRIGIRELKNRASEIVHEVQERKAEYVVTLRGEPVAVLLPFPQEGQREHREEALQKLDALAEQIARSWRSPKTAQELVEEQRR